MYHRKTTQVKDSVRNISATFFPIFLCFYESASFLFSRFMLSREREHKRQLVNSQLCRRCFSEAKGVSAVIWWHRTKQLPAVSSPSAPHPSSPAWGGRWDWWASPWPPPAGSGASGTCRRPGSTTPAAGRTAGSPSCCASRTCGACGQLRRGRVNDSPVRNLNDATFEMCKSNSSSCQEAEAPFEGLTHFKCQKKKWPILWLVKAFFSRKRDSGLSRYCSYFRT